MLPSDALAEYACQAIKVFETLPEMAHVESGFNLTAHERMDILDFQQKCYVNGYCLSEEELDEAPAFCTCQLRCQGGSLDFVTVATAYTMKGRLCEHAGGGVGWKQAPALFFFFCSGLF